MKIHNVVGGQLKLASESQLKEIHQRVWISWDKSVSG